MLDPPLDELQAIYADWRPRDGERAPASLADIRALLDDEAACGGSIERRAEGVHIWRRQRTVAIVSDPDLVGTAGEPGAEIAFAAYGDPRFEALLHDRTAAPLPAWCARAESEHDAVAGRVRAVAYTIATTSGPRRAASVAEVAGMSVDPSAAPSVEKAIAHGEAAALGNALAAAVAHEEINAEAERGLRRTVLAGANGFTTSLYASSETAGEAARLRTLLDDPARPAIDIPMDEGLARATHASAGLDMRSGIDGKAVVRFERPYLEALHAVLRDAAKKHPSTRDAIRVLERQYDSQRAGSQR